MNWVDPKNWDDEKTYGIDQITALISHFKVPLKAAGFDSKAVFKEWRFLKITLKQTILVSNPCSYGKRFLTTKKRNIAIFAS